MYYGPVSDAVEVSVEELTLDDECQQRAGFDEPTVARYAELMGDGVEFTPVRALLDEEGTYWVYDGFMRVEAARRAGWQVIPVLAEPGDRREAVFRSTSANADHGLPRSAADIRRALYTIWDDAEYSARFSSRREIAEHVGVSHTTVNRHYERWSQERGIVPKATPKGNAAPAIQGASAGASPGHEPTDAAANDSETDAEWRESGEIESPKARRVREWCESLRRLKGVRARLSEECRSRLESELAFWHEIKGTVDLLRDKLTQNGGNARKGPLSTRVRWLARCDIEAAKACVSCEGTGINNAGDDCPHCKGNGFTI